MALNLTKIFTDAGISIQQIDALFTFAKTTLPGYASAVITQLNSDSLYDELGTLNTDSEAWQDVVLTWIQRYITAATNVYQSAALFIPFVPAPSKTPSFTGFTLPEYWHQMGAAAFNQTIKRSTVTLGSPTADAANYGNAQVAVTKRLDGYNPPWQGGPTAVQLANVNSECAVPSETVTLQCIADSATSGVSIGSEQWSWTGGIRPRSSTGYDWQFEGSGAGPSLTSGNSSTLITDGSFENWTATNTPSSWPIDNGVAGVNIFQDTTAADVLFGNASLKILGDGATATIGVHQALTPSSFNPNRLYCVGVWIKGQAGIVAGTLTITGAGTGYSPGGSDNITLNAGTLAGLANYTFYSFYILTPSIVPSDFKITISVTGTLTNAKQITLDGFSLAPVVYHGGFGVNVFSSGDNTSSSLKRPLIGDRFTFTVANDDAGKFQRFFRRAYKFQLRSAGGGGETISDALA